MYRVPVGCDLTVASAENMPLAVARIEAAMAPPTKQQAEDWLVMLQVACAGGRKSEIGQAVALELYAGTLSRYPVDVARAACQNMALRPRGSANWFPTLAEINAECERLAGPRQTTLHALQHWKPKSEAARLRDEAYDLRYAAAKADTELFHARRNDPDRASELEEFRLAVIAQASGLEAEARRLERPA